MTSCKIQQSESIYNYAYFQIGVAAMGKTYKLSAFANDWAHHKTVNKSDVTHPASFESFDLIFLIRLRHVTDDAPLETIIAQQHELSTTQEKGVKDILDGNMKCKVLFCFDGYDEYQPGINKAIDRAICAPNANYNVLVSSRPGQYVSRTVIGQMNFQVQLEGFKEDEIRKCTKDYLGKPTEAEEFLRNLENGLDDLKKIPAFLLMMLQLHEEKSLPKKKTEVIWNIIRKVIDRSVQRHFDKTVDEMENLDQMLVALGELSWNALLHTVNNLVINKVSFYFFSLNIFEI